MNKVKNNELIELHSNIYKGYSVNLDELYKHHEALLNDTTNPMDPNIFLKYILSISTEEYDLSSQKYLKNKNKLEIQSSLIKAALDKKADLNESNINIYNLEILATNHELFLEYSPARFLEWALKCSVEESVMGQYIIDKNKVKLRNELIKVTLEKSDVNIQNNQGQTPLFFAQDIDSIELLINKGADLNIKDNQGLLWINKLSSSLLEEVINNNYLLKEQANQVAHYHLNRGNYEHAAKLAKVDFSPKADPVDAIVTAIINGLEKSIEIDKYHAILNLADKAAIEIPNPFKYLLDNYKDNHNSEEFDFLLGIVHKLAKHYINLSKADLAKTLKKESELNDEAKQELDYAFKTFDFNGLKSLYPDNIELAKINNEFDSYYQVFGKAINILDNDFALEVLTLNGLRPDTLEQDTIVYRGITKSLSSEDIHSYFKYGYRAFSSTKNQKFLGFYAENSWNDVGGPYEYGGTYTTLSPDIGYAYASNGGTLFEIKAPMNSMKICGIVEYYKEIVLNSIKGEDIIAIYTMNNNSIDKVYKNPYLDEAIYPSLQANKSNSDIDWQNTYDSLGCNKLPIVFPTDSSNRAGIYKDHTDFIERYTPEKYAADKLQLIKDYFIDREIYVEDFHYELQGECNLAFECCA